MLTEKPQSKIKFNLTNSGKPGNASLGHQFPTGEGKGGIPQGPVVLSRGGAVPGCTLTKIRFYPRPQPGDPAEQELVPQVALTVQVIDLKSKCHIKY